MLRTNTKIAALQVVLRYRNLLAVEDAFKTAKALLATRPIFHKTDAGIRGHVFCTFSLWPKFRSFDLNDVDHQWLASHLRF